MLVNYRSKGFCLNFKRTFDVSTGEVTFTCEANASVFCGWGGVVGAYNVDTKQLM